MRKENFLLTKEACYELVEVLRPYLSLKGPSLNFRALDADKKLAVCLYCLKVSSG